MKLTFTSNINTHSDVMVETFHRPVIALSPDQLTRIEQLSRLATEHQVTHITVDADDPQTVVELVPADKNADPLGHEGPHFIVRPHGEFSLAGYYSDTGDYWETDLLTIQDFVKAA